MIPYRKRNSRTGTVVWSHKKCEGLWTTSDEKINWRKSDIKSFCYGPIAMPESFTKAG